MKNNWKDWRYVSFGHALVFFLFGLSSLLSLLFNQVWLYQLVTTEKNAITYRALLHYLNRPWISTLTLPDLPMSMASQTHFADVRILLWIIYSVAFVLGGILLTSFFRQRTFWSYPLTASYLRYWQIGLCIVLCWAVVDFQSLFLLLHEMIFTNDTWLLSATSDPVILLFPDNYFFVCYSLLVVLLLVWLQLQYWSIKKSSHDYS